jgi:hypothetical protein
MKKYLVTLSDSLLARVEDRMERRAGEDEEPLQGGEALLFLVEYALSRMDVLDANRHKVAEVKALLKAGQPIPEELKFKRYVPSVPVAEAASTAVERPVVSWAAKAPRKSGGPGHRPGNGHDGRTAGWRSQKRPTPRILTPAEVAALVRG